MIIFLLLAFQPSGFEFDVASGTGLTIRANGVPIVRGSWFQYYEPGWTKGYYSSQGSDQRIERVDANTVRMSFDQGLTKGQTTYRREGNRLLVDHQYEWTGEGSVLVETGNLMWSPAFVKGSLLADAAPTRDLAQRAFSEPGITQRRFSPDAKNYVLDAPVAKVSVASQQPLTFFDARGYDQAWAEGTQVWWLGATALEVARDKPANLQMVWTIEPKALPQSQPLNAKATVKAVKDARVPDERLPVLVPRPKTNQLNYEKAIAYTGRFTYPAGRVRFMSDFTQGLARRFVVPAVDPKAKAIEVDAGVSKLGFNPGGYRITIGPNSITVLGEEDDGLRNGWRRLSQLAFVRNGKIMLPTGSLLDQPRLKWRGVHLFVGPQAPTFHRNLWERVLLPMGFNNVLLQCDRTDWKATPGIATAMSMKREDLARLFTMYRNLLVEPTPLIQSWGHMEWLFANGKNRDLAFNKDVLYSIDPRKPEARKTIAAIWDEAAALLEPKALHFGLDEVDMRGWPKDPELVTTIWEDYLPFLTGISKKHKAEAMLWGDKMLAPGEAPDAALGDSKEHAARRRKVLPKGTTITDWHYKADLNPRTFYPSIRLFKDSGFRPIASGWYSPANIKGLATAADIERVGYLQTTWAGYESNEAYMLKALPQFAAMIVAAEYAWAGREENPSNLGYDPMEMFRRLYFGRPSPVAPIAGSFVTVGQAGQTISIEGTRFQTFAPLALASSLAAGGASSITMPVKANGRGLWLAVDTLAGMNDGEAVAEVEAKLVDGKSVKRTIRYGQDVRALDDAAATTVAPREGRLSAVRLGLPAGIAAFSIRPLSPLAGLRVHGVTVAD